jgi:hypothetical protein
MARPRPLVVVTVLAAAALAIACGTKQSPQSDATTQGSGVVVVTTTGSTAAPTTAAPAPTTAVPISYPSDARAYAEAILAAWKNGDATTLAALTVSGVPAKYTGLSPQPNKTWHYSRCEGAAGSSYCVFFNDNGDMITVRLSNQSLGAAHANTDMTFDKTTFPATAKDYVKAFTDAWQQGNTWRMTALSKTDGSVTSYFTHYTPPDVGYLVCDDGGGAAGSTYVHVYNHVGLNHVMQVSNPALGQAHGIVGYLSPPPPVPLTCP